MICKECGAYNPDHATYCKVCAANLKGEPEAEPAEDAVVEDQQPTKRFSRPSWVVPEQTAKAAPVEETVKEEAENLFDDEDPDDLFEQPKQKPAKKQRAPEPVEVEDVEEVEEEDDEPEEEPKRHIFTPSRSRVAKQIDDDEDEDEDDEDEDEEETDEHDTVYNDEEALEDDEDSYEYEPTPPKRKSSKKKGSGRVSEIGLYSSRMEFVHPITKEEIFLHKEPEGAAFDIMDQMDW